MKLRKAMRKRIDYIVNADTHDWRIVKLVDGKYRLYADHRRATNEDPFQILSIEDNDPILDTKGWF